MQLRYNYRAYPDAAQCRALARAFGCARGSGRRAQAVDGHRHRSAAGSGDADRAAYPRRSRLPAPLDHTVTAQPGPALSAQEHLVGATTVGCPLHAMGYSLQGTAKTTEGARHPDRDAPFAHINATATAFLDDGQPVIGVDTKAKEWIRNRDRPGRVWRPGKDPRKWSRLMVCGCEAEFSTCIALPSHRYLTHLRARSSCKLV